jgi:hypothetical protein
MRYVVTRDVLWFPDARRDRIQAIRVNDLTAVERLGRPEQGHDEVDIATDRVNHGTMVMVPQTSLLLLEAWLPAM